MNEEEYLKAQAECGIEVGDMVKVLRKAEGGENGWNNSWVGKSHLPDDNDIRMDGMIGQIFEVLGIDGHGISLEDSGGADWGFPYFVLEKQEANNG